MNLPEKFKIPKERIPRAFSQGPYNDCVAITFTKILEVISFVKTGEYIALSKGYMYGRNNRPGKTQGGMDYTYTLNKLMERGTVPEVLCPERDEIPVICEKLEKRADISELDKLAEKTRIEGWEHIKGNIYMLENIKKCLYEHKMPIAGNRTGSKQHCVVIIGWDGDKLIYQDHDKDGRERSVKGGFNSAYYIDGGVENKMKLMNADGFKAYIDSLKVTRKITVVQLHHTYSPSYSQFDGNNHIELQEGMKNYHIKTRGYSDIAQNFTIFPDGKICTGRDINTVPAGIYGANSTGICIECVGNFDKGGDVMTEAQKNTVAAATKILLERFGLDVKTGVTYHAWWTSGGTAIGTYIAGRSTKTCPGTNFFGGNTRVAYEKGLMKMIENIKTTPQPTMSAAPLAQGSLRAVTEINDIVWELTNAGIITDGKLWIKKCEEDINVYWLCRKMANKLRGTL